MITAADFLKWCEIFKVPIGGGGGSGTVTSITAGTGLAGGTITTSGTISLEAIPDLHLLGNDAGSTGVPGPIAVGSGLNLSGSVLSATGGGVTDTDVQESAFNFTTDTVGTGTDYAGVLSPAIGSYTNGLLVYLAVVNTNNTNFPTLDMGPGPTNIILGSGFNIAIGDIVADSIAVFQYSAADTSFQLLNPATSLDACIQSINGAYNGGTDGGGAANVYTFTNTFYPNVPAQLSSNVFLKIGNSNTGAATFDFNGTGAVAIVLPDGSPLVGGEMVVNGISILYFDGTNWQLLNPFSVNPSGIYLPLAGGTMSGAIDMGTNQIHNVVDPTSAQDAATQNYVLSQLSGTVTPAQVQNQAFTYSGTAGGSTNAYTATLSPALGSLVAGQTFFANIASINTSSLPTLAVDGLAAKNIRFPNNMRISNSDIGGGWASLFQYNGTEYKLLIPNSVYLLPSLIFGAQWQYINDSGTTNAYAGFTFFPNEYYTTSFIVYLKPASTNTGACTLTLGDSKGVNTTYDIKAPSGSDPAAGMIRSGYYAILQYDGVNLQLLNPAITAITEGGTGVTSVSTAPAATAWAGWDANENFSANSFIPGYATTVTAAGTTTLTVSSAQQQYFTGSTTQTVVMPVTSTLVAGQPYQIVNLSSGVVTVQSSGTNTIQTMAANTILNLTVINTGVTTAAGWNGVYQPLTPSASGASISDFVSYTYFGGV